jgi:hypothetical protein
VVQFYDTLMRRRVDLPALARASAALAECVAGIALDATGRTIRRGPDGHPHPPEFASDLLNGYRQPSSSGLGVHPASPLGPAGPPRAAR